MSSTGPIPQPGAESLVRSMDVLRQQQQEMIQKLALAQQQAAKQQAEAQRQQAEAQVQAAAKQLEAVKQQATLQMAAGQVAGQLMTGQVGAMKTPPLPGMTTEALQARLNEQLTKMTTTLQRQQQAVTDALSKGGLTAGVAGVMIGQAQGAAEQMRAEMDLLKSQIDALSNHQQQEMVRLQQLTNRYNEVFNLLSNISKTQHDTAQKIIQNLR
jgi:uncharacterized protein YPO0396